MKVLNTTFITLILGLIACMIATLVNDLSLPQFVSALNIENFVGIAGDHSVFQVGSHFLTHDQSGVQEIARAGEMLSKAMGCDLVSVQFGVVECVK